MQKLKNEKGSISLYVLLAMLFFLIVVMSVGIYAKNKEAAAESELEKIKESYEEDVGNESEIYERAQNEGEYVSGEWDEDKGVNTPVLVDGLIPVVYDTNGNPVEVNSTDDNWYDYDEQKWANAITKDTSGNITGYWVWIPRFEYVLDSTSQTATVKFIPTSQTTVDSGYSYIHPAFRDGSTTYYTNGEWDDEIPGFWVAKYPAGYQANTITDDNGTLDTEISNSSDTVVYSSKNYTSYYSSYTTNALGQDLSSSGYASTTMSYPVFLPLTYAYNVISIGDSYTLAQEIDSATDFYGLNSSEVDSHMMKNSEWGAVAYLSQSQYGRNGTEMNINNYYTSTSSPYRVAVTGVYASGVSTGSTTTITSEYAYYTDTGVLGSSTGNITGVYDLNGCVWERVAGYITNGDSNLSYGSSFVKTTTANADGYLTLSTKYATVYPYNSSSDTKVKNWTMYSSLSTSSYGYGDAILETSAVDSEESTSWYSDYAYYPRTSTTFLVRGGKYDLNVSAGVFEFSGASGFPIYYSGFRAVLIAQRSDKNK